MATVSLDEKRADSFCVWVTAETHRYRNQLVRYQPAWSGVGSGGALPPFPTTPRSAILPSIVRLR